MFAQIAERTEHGDSLTARLARTVIALHAIIEGRTVAADGRRSSRRTTRPGRDDRAPRRADRRDRDVMAVVARLARREGRRSRDGGRWRRWAPCAWPEGVPWLRRGAWSPRRARCWGCYAAGTRGDATRVAIARNCALWHWLTRGDPRPSGVRRSARADGARGGFCCARRGAADGDPDGAAGAGGGVERGRGTGRWRSRCAIASGPPRPGSHASRLARAGGRWRLSRQHRENFRPAPARGACAAARGGARDDARRARHREPRPSATPDLRRSRRGAGGARPPCALRLRGRMTARAWLERFAREDRIGACPWREVEHDRPLFALLYRLSDAREDVWRHPTHADSQAGAVVACLAAILRVDCGGPTTPQPPARTRSTARTSPRLGAGRRGDAHGRAPAQLRRGGGSARRSSRWERRRRCRDDAAPPPRGLPECGLTERLRPDGTMVQHTRRWRVCKGTGREPVAGPSPRGSTRRMRTLARGSARRSER